MCRRARDVTSLMEHLTSRIFHSSTFSQRTDQAEPILSQSILRFKFWTYTIQSRIMPIVVYFKTSNRRHLFIYWDGQFYSFHHSSSFYKTIKIISCSMGLYIRNLGATPSPLLKNFIQPWYLPRSDFFTLTISRPTGSTMCVFQIERLKTYRS